MSPPLETGRAALRRSARWSIGRLGAEDRVLRLKGRLRVFDLEGVGPYTRDQFDATFTEPIWNFLAAPA